MLSGSPDGARLRALIAEILRIDPEQIDEHVDMEETSTWDSLSHMELIAAIEDEFHIDLTSDDIIAMTGVAKIAALLRARGAAV